jgi:hypothetical protein
VKEMLTADEKEFLLKLARHSIEAAVESKKLPAVNLKDFSGLLAENGASFVTLTIRGELRGCIGALEPYQPFVMDVQEHAVAAALEDPSQAEFYDKALDRAQKLYEEEQLIPAGIVSATVLENYLKWMCRRRNLKLNEELLSLKEMNDALCRFRTYKDTTWLRIQVLIPIADACLRPHEEKPTNPEVKTLIAGLRRVLGTGH